MIGKGPPGWFIDRYRDADESVQETWHSSVDSTYIAIAVSGGSTEKPYVRVELWKQRILRGDQAFARTEDWPGQVEFEMILFEGITGDHIPDLLMVGYIEEELGFPILLSRADDGEFIEYLQDVHGDIIRPLEAKDSIFVERTDGRGCAIGVPAAVGRDAPTRIQWFWWIDRELQPVERTTACGK